MKRIFSIMLSLVLILSSLVLIGCSLLSSKREPEIIKNFIEETDPSKIIKTKENWVVLHNTYGSDDYVISVRENLDDLPNNIYSAEDVSIWFLSANENGIAWCEESEDFYTYKVYVFESQTVETIFKSPVSDGFQDQNIGIFSNSVYYCTVDYKHQEVCVRKYDIASKEATDILKEVFVEENQPYCIDLENEYLSFSSSNKVEVFNLKKNECVFESDLLGVKYIFNVSYDSKNDICAIYYADSNSEDIGILKDGQKSIVSHFTFSKNHYAYHDKLECYDGHIYWIVQANVSGEITDHYTFVDYDYNACKPVETTRSLAFTRTENDIYILRFNKNGSWTHIDLCKH